MRVYPAAGPCIACGEESDEFAIGYSKEGERIYRHRKASLAHAKGSQPFFQGLGLSLHMSTFLGGLMAEMPWW